MLNDFVAYLNQTDVSQITWAQYMEPSQQNGTGLIDLYGNARPAWHTFHFWGDLPVERVVSAHARCMQRPAPLCCFARLLHAGGDQRSRCLCITASAYLACAHVWSLTAKRCLDACCLCLRICLIVEAVIQVDHCVQSTNTSSAELLSVAGFSKQLCHGSALIWNVRPYATLNLFTLFTCSYW